MPASRGAARRDGGVQVLPLGVELLATWRWSLEVSRVGCALGDAVVGRWARRWLAEELLRGGCRCELLEGGARSWRWQVVLLLATWRELQRGGLPAGHAGRWRLLAEGAGYEDVGEGGGVSEEDDGGGRGVCWVVLLRAAARATGGVEEEDEVEME